jgi:GTPase SAR1 family protein
MIGHKHDTKIYLIERYVINKLKKKIISCSWVYTDARLEVDVKKLFLETLHSKTVSNSCNGVLVTHIQVDLP